MQHTHSTSRLAMGIATLLMMLAFLPSAFAVGAGSGGGTGSDNIPAPEATPEPAPEPAPTPNPESTPPPAGDPTPGPSNSVTIGTETNEAKEWTECLEDGFQEVVGNPDERRVCEGLQCGHLESMEERVECRLNLSDEELKAEFAILYFPEYCKVEETDEEKQACIDLYKTFRPCWDLEAGEARVACGMEKTGTDTFEADLSACQAETGDTRQACAEALEEKVENFLLFTMYELEFKAESLLEQGRTDQASVVDLIVFVEEQKADVETAGSLSEWKTIASDTQSGWNDFVSKLNK